MADYECLLRVTKGGGETHWTPAKPDGFKVGDEITFGSEDGFWVVSFVESPFKATPQSETLGGNANVFQTAKIVRTGEFPCDCHLHVNGVAVANWNGSDGRSGDDVKVPRPP